MKKAWFIAAVFLLVSLSGCATAGEGAGVGRQGYNLGQQGYNLGQQGYNLGQQAEGYEKADVQQYEGARTGFTTGLGNTGWPGKSAGESYTVGNGTGVGNNTSDGNNPIARNAGRVTGSTGESGIQIGQVSAAGSALGSASGRTSRSTIRILQLKSPVKLGESGMLMIEGVAGTRYTVTAVYNNTLGAFTSTAVRTTGTDGRAEWIWKVRENTIPGTYGLMISGGGDVMAVSYTVTAK